MDMEEMSSMSNCTECTHLKRDDDEQGISKRIRVSRDKYLGILRKHTSRFWEASMSHFLTIGKPVKPPVIPCLGNCIGNLTSRKLNNKVMDRCVTSVLWEFA